MIDSNNDLKKLSKGLLDAVRGVMEAKKVNKHGHDPVGKEDADIDNDGDVDKSDSYLHNRRKAIKASMKKEEVEVATPKVSGLDIARNVLNKMRNEEVEDLEELSVNKLKDYRTKARADAYDADDVDDERRFRKRAAGSNMAGKKIVRQGGSLKTEEVELDEALDAAARYGDHHTAIKSLLKSISQHVENHKSDALKHKDYRGKKGVHWGHVGDLAQVHSQLADIHDRLAQQGEYKKSLGESVEDLDIEQIDELSKYAMLKYLAANKKSDKAAQEAGDLDKMTKRMRGTDVAVRKYTAKPGSKYVRVPATEEVEHIDELSKATLRSYAQNAKDQMSRSDTVSGRLAGERMAGGKPSAKERMHNRRADKRYAGLGLAIDKLAREEVEQVDEAPVDGVAAGSMANDGHLCATKVFHKEWAEGTPLFSQHAEPDADGNIAWYDVMFEHGIEKGVSIDDLDVLMVETHERHGKRKMKEDVEIDEARGRPPKEGSVVWKARQAAAKTGNVEGDEPRQHIIQQLQRAKLSMQGGAKIRFKNGEEHHVHGTHAANLLSKYAGMKPHEKETFQKKIGASHEGLKSEL